MINNHNNIYNLLKCGQHLTRLLQIKTFKDFSCNIITWKHKLN